MEHQALHLLGFLDALKTQKFAELQALFDQHKSALSSLLDQAQQEVLELVGQQQENEGPALKRPARTKGDRTRADASVGDSMLTQDEPTTQLDAPASGSRKRRGAAPSARTAPAKRGRARQPADQPAAASEGATTQSLPDHDMSATVVAERDVEDADDASSAPPQPMASHQPAAPQPVQGRVTRGRARGAPAPAPAPRVTRARKRAAAPAPELYVIQEEETAEAQEAAASPVPLAVPDACALAGQVGGAAAAEAAGVALAEKDVHQAEPEAAAPTISTTHPANSPACSRPEADEAPVAAGLSAPADGTDALVPAEPAVTPGTRSFNAASTQPLEVILSPSSTLDKAGNATYHQTLSSQPEGQQDCQAHDTAADKPQKEAPEQLLAQATAEQQAEEVAAGRANEPGSRSEDGTGDKSEGPCAADALSPAPLTSVISTAAAATPSVMAATPSAVAATVPDATAAAAAAAAAAPQSAPRRSLRSRMSPILDTSSMSYGRRSPSFAAEQLPPAFNTEGAETAASGRRSSRRTPASAAKVRSLSFGQQVQESLLDDSAAHVAAPDFTFSSGSAGTRAPRVSFAGFALPTSALEQQPGEAWKAVAAVDGHAHPSADTPPNAFTQQQQQQQQQQVSYGDVDGQDSGPAMPILMGATPPVCLPDASAPVAQQSLLGSGVTAAQSAAAAADTPAAGNGAAPGSQRRLTRSAVKGSSRQQETAAEQDQHEEQASPVLTSLRVSTFAVDSPVHIMEAAIVQQQPQPAIKQTPTKSVAAANVPGNSQAGACAEPVEATVSAMAAPAASTAGTASTSDGAQAEAHDAAPATLCAAAGPAGKAGGNLVSGVRSFLPSVLPKKGSPGIAAGKVKVKVKALEAAMASKKAEEARQAEKARLKLAAEGKAAAPATAAAPRSIHVPGASTEAAAADAAGKQEAVGLARQPAAAATQQPAQRVLTDAAEAETPAGSGAASKVATLERLAGGNSGSGGAVRVPVVQKAEEDATRKAAGDKEAAKRKAEKDAEAARKQMDKHEREERMRRAEAKRKEEDARRRQELEEKQRAKEERAKKQQAALAAHKAEAGANGAGPGAAAAGARSKGAEAVAPAANAVKLAKAQAHEASDHAADFRSPNPTLKGASSAAVASKANENQPPQNMQPMCTPGMAADHASPANMIKMLAPVSNSMAQPPTQQPTAFKTPGLACVAQTPPAEPISEQDRHNIEVLKNSPFVRTSSKRTPRTAGLAMQPSSYEISPYRDDDVETPERSGKPIPDWARGARLMDALRRQQFMDPDKVFSARRTDCPLEEVFHGVEVQLDAAAAARAQNKRALHKRTSSGDWSQDRLTWQEQVGYKKAMGFL